MESEIMLLYPIIFFFGLCVFAICVASLVGPSQTKIYRRDLSNMYIIGKIKQLADKDGIKIVEEFAEFAKITKNKKIDFESLDNTIEREMQEKIANKPNVKKITPGVPFR